MRTLLLFVALALPVSAGGLRAGFAKEDLTPDRPVPLAGYGDRKGRPSTGVHDKVWARAAVFEREGRWSAILSVDMVGVSGEVREKLVDGKCKTMGIASEDFLFCATHNHSGPGALSRNALIQAAAGKFDEKLFDEVIGKLENALSNATLNMSPVTLQVRKARFDGLSRNRAVAGGPTDPDGFVAEFENHGVLVGILVGLAAHATILGSENFEVSADWPGAMCAELEKAYPEQPAVMFLNGAEGDQSPVSDEGKDDWERVAKMGKAVADVVQKVLAGPAKPVENAAVFGVAKEFDLPLNAFEADKSAGASSWPTNAVVQIFNVGSLRLFCFPGEPCVDVGRLATALAADADHLNAVVACANEHLGYFVPEDYYFKGGYESTLSFLGPKCGEWFADRFRELLGIPIAVPPVPDMRAVNHGRFKEVITRGTPYQVGLGHGRALGQEIRTHCDFWREQLKAMAGALPVKSMLPFPDGVDPAPLLYPLLAVRCRMLLRDAEPALIEEMRGIADGAGVAFDEIVFLNTWLAVADQTDPTALFKLKPGCATAAAGNLLAHNSDWPPQKSFPGVAALVIVVPKDGRPLAMLTLAGCVGAPAAMNADGVGCAVDSLPAPDDTSLEGTPVWLSVRAALQFNRSAPDVAEALELSTGTAGYLVTIADSEETIRLEMSATHSDRDPATPRAVPKKDRKKREAVAEFLKTTPAPGVAALETLFGKKESGVLSPSTRSSVVMELAERRWQVSAGPGEKIEEAGYLTVELKKILKK